MSDTEEVDEIPTDFTIPNYVPLPPSSYTSLGQIIPARNNVPLIENAIKQITQNADRFVKFVLEEEASNIPEVAKILQGYATTLERILSSKFQFEVRKSALQTTKSEYQKEMHNEDDFGVKTLDKYRAIDPMSISDHLERQFSIQEETKTHSLFSFLQKNETYQFISKAAFVIQHPEDPLPESKETDQEDDLEIAGGKVSLLDPMSLAQLVDPVKSRKCNHVYEKHSIEDHFKKGGKDCPVDGCNSRLSHSDIVPDPLMSLRLLGFRVATTTTNEDIDKL